MLQSKEQLHVAAKVICDILNVNYNCIQFHIMATFFSNSKGAAIPRFESDDDGEITYRGSHVVINPYLCGDGWLKVLCHELIHVQQMQSGRLSYYYDASLGYDINFHGPIPMLMPIDKPRIFWEGSDFTGLVWMMHETRSESIYRALPWEAEAFAFESQVLQLIDFMTEERIRGIA